MATDLFPDGAGHRRRTMLEVDTVPERRGGQVTCDSNNCPVGIATQRADRSNRLVSDSAADWGQNVFAATVTSMQLTARACGQDSLGGANQV